MASTPATGGDARLDFNLGWRRWGESVIDGARKAGRCDRQSNYAASKMGLGAGISAARTDSGRGWVLRHAACGHVRSGQSSGRNPSGAGRDPGGHDAGRGLYQLRSVVRRVSNRRPCHWRVPIALARPGRTRLSGNGNVVPGRDAGSRQRGDSARGPRCDRLVGLD